MIELQNITKSFKGDFLNKERVILNNISFKVECGKIYGLLGNNGAGKSTLLKIIMKLTSPNKGKVVFEKKCEAIKDISYSPEYSTFYSNLSAIEFLYFVGSIQGIKKKDIKERGFYWFSKLSLSPFINLKIKKFSHGMLKKLSFISSILNEPKFIILDEPFSGLDLNSREVLKNILISFKKSDKGILLTSHLSSDIESLLDEIFYLKNGNIFNKNLALENKASNFIFKIKKTKDTILFYKTLFSKNEELLIEVPEKGKNDVIVDLLGKGCIIEEIFPKKDSLKDIIIKLEKGD